MIVKHPKAVEQLLRHRVLATLRTYPYEEGRHVIIKLPDGRRALGRVALVLPDFTDDDLRQFVALSGFETAEEWYVAALDLHGERPKYLVLVKLIRWVG